MTAPRTLARPYAQAVFELAKANEQIAAWSATLAILSQIMANSKLIEVYQDPRQSSSQMIDFILKILAEIQPVSIEVKTFYYYYNKLNVYYCCLKFTIYLPKLAKPIW